MAELRQFRLPDIGEGLTEGEILQWLVAVGDVVAVNQPLCEVETAKAAVELPSPFAGTVTEVLHAVGDTVDVGAPIVTIDVGRRRAAADDAPSAPAAPAGGPGDGGSTPGARTPVLVGYGPRDTEARRRPRAATAPRPAPPGDPSAAGGRASAATDHPPLLATAPDARTKPVRHGGLEVGRAAEAHAAAGDAAWASAAAPGRRRPRPLAKPPVRKLARDLGIDLTAVAGTGDGGVITRADVEAAAGRQGRGREERIAVKGVRKHTAAAMVRSAFTAPQVTEFLTVDVTRTMRLRSRLAARPELAGLKIGPLLLVARAVLLAVRRHPMVNSSWDDAAQEIVVKDYVNLGIAAATPRGLVVPNIKDAGRLSLPELARALAELAENARAGRIAPADLAGGTITITNVGVFGVDTGTPIVNSGEAAILALGAVRELPWVHKGRVKPRQVTQLALSFDHRIVDGELGGRFLADIGTLLSDPATALAC